MPVLPYSNRLEPVSDAAVWRFMDLRKFRDLMASEELYFRRADLFNDKSEGLPPEDYATRVLGLNPYDIRDRSELNRQLGSLAQHRESYYINCWYLYRQETLDMWEQYGHDGVAVCSRYELLNAALEGLLDEAHLGLVQYGASHIQRAFNALEFITTKQTKYTADTEVRVFLTVYDPLAGGNRHFDLENVAHPAPLDVNPRHSWVPDCKRRRINLRSLITDVVISPWAEPDAVDEIHLWVKHKGFPESARPSDLTGATTPTLDEFRKFRHIASTRVPEQEIVEESHVPAETWGHPAVRRRSVPRKDSGNSRRLEATGCRYWLTQRKIRMVRFELCRRGCHYLRDFNCTCSIAQQRRNRTLDSDDYSADERERPRRW